MALEVKSLTQALKQVSTRLPKSCVGGQGQTAILSPENPPPPKKKNSLRARCTFGTRGGCTYADELLDLALLHALLEVALLGCAQSAESVVCCRVG